MPLHVLSVPAIAAWMYLSIPGSAVAYLWMFRLVQRYSSIQVAYIIPGESCCRGFVERHAWLLHKSLTLNLVLGKAAIVIGAWSVQQPQ